MTPAPSVQASERSVKPLRVALASFIGTAIEWYDYFIYGMAAALVFGPLFFPEFSPVAGTLAAFATFSVGFLARPLGGVVMGHFGDRVGRKSMLVISLMLMGFATVGIGLLPTYATIGYWAPLLLVTLRFIQGIGVGGEWGGAVLMAVEHAPPNKKAFYGSFPQMGVPGGIILANVVFLGMTAAVSPEAFLAWGWRVPFLASSVMVIVGLIVRFTITESPDFEQVKQAKSTARMPILTVLRQHPKQVMLAAGMMIGNSAIGYIVMVYVLSYGTQILGMDRSLVLILILAAAAIWLIVTPWASALSDRHGRHRILLISSVGLVFATAAILPIVDTENTLLILLGLAVTGIFLGGVYGPLAATVAALFPANVRYSGSSLGYQIGVILGGGIVPTVATALYANWQSSTAVTSYLVGLTVISLGCVIAAARAEQTQPQQAPKSSMTA